MANTLEEALVHIFGHEGGFTKDPRDPGNWTGGKVGVGENRGTKYGIACHAHPNVDIVNLTIAQAAQIYRVQYAAPIGYVELPAGVDLVAFDASVNSGPAASLRFLGRALSVTWTKAAVVAAANASADKIAVIKGACAERLAFMRSLAIWVTYGVGWSRRVASIEATAVKWWLRAHGTAPAQIKQQLAAESKTADQQSKNDVKGAVATTGTSAAAGGTSWWAALEWYEQTALIIFAILFVLAVINFVKRAIVNRQRSAAYQEAANAA